MVQSILYECLAATPSDNDGKIFQNPAHSIHSHIPLSQHSSPPRQTEIKTEDKVLHKYDPTHRDLCKDEKRHSQRGPFGRRFCTTCCGRSPDKALKKRVREAGESKALNGDFIDSGICTRKKYTKPKNSC